MPAVPSSPPRPARPPSFPALPYAAMLLATAGGFALVRRAGAGLVAAPLAGAGTEAAAPPVRAADDTLLHVLLALAVVIVAARLLGALFARLHQPPVIGEVLAGLLLGPSLLGRVAPAAYGFLLPAQISPYLGVLSQVGVILYMFLVGLELDARQLWRGGGSALAISHAGMLLPFLLGAALSLLLYPRLASPAVSFSLFAMFVGTALSVTAFPVLARILTDRGIQRSRLGVLSLTCAAAADASAWCLLAVCASLAGGGPARGLHTTALTLAYVAVMLLVGRPLLARAPWLRAPGPPSQQAVAFTFVALLLSALCTEAIGIHAIFGAFLLGAILPHDGELAHALTVRLLDVVTIFLLPAFFAFVGMRTQLGLVQGAPQWILCALIVLVASVGKLGGTAAAARWLGLPWREAAALGVLMNTRGLMELIVLNLGLDLGILSPTVFAMMVLMALATTLATAPLLTALTANQAELVAPAGTRPA